MIVASGEAILSSWGRRQRVNCFSNPRVLVAGSKGGSKEARAKPRVGGRVGPERRPGPRTTGAIAQGWRSKHLHRS